MKNFAHEYLMHEYFYAQKFQDLYYSHLSKQLHILILMTFLQFNMLKKVNDGTKSTLNNK